MREREYIQYRTIYKIPDSHRALICQETRKEYIPMSKRIQAEEKLLEHRLKILMAQKMVSGTSTPNVHNT